MSFPEIISSVLRKLINLSACYCWVSIRMFIQLKTGNKENCYLNRPFCGTEKLTQMVKNGVIYFPFQSRYFNMKLLNKLTSAATVLFGCT
jgi:hypothetical protein